MASDCMSVDEGYLQSMCRNFIVVIKLEELMTWLRPFSFNRKSSFRPTVHPEWLGGNAGESQRGAPTCRPNLCSYSGH